MRIARHNQQGSAEVVVIACLVAVIAFALGWIFWQNFIHKEPVKVETNITNSNTKTNPDTPAKEERVLLLTDWQVEILLKEDSPECIAKYESFEMGGAYYIRSKLQGCTDGDGKAIDPASGAIGREIANHKVTKDESGMLGDDAAGKARQQVWAELDQETGKKTP